MLTLGYSSARRREVTGGRWHGLRPRARGVATVAARGTTGCQRAHLMGFLALGLRCSCVGFLTPRSRVRDLVIRNSANSYGQLTHYRKASGRMLARDSAELTMVTTSRQLVWVPYARPARFLSLVPCLARER